MASAVRATLDDLYEVDGKAELIGGRIVHFMPTGIRPSEVASEIYLSLREHSKKTKKGRAFNDNLGYAVPELPSGRESFCPDASYYTGKLPKNRMRFVEGPPGLAVEVRSEGDYGLTAETEIAEKRADYFAAGTKVVWDVDPLAECVHVYRASNPNQPTTYRRRQMAEAEPAVPGWQIAMDAIFG